MGAGQTFGQMMETGFDIMRPTLKFDRTIEATIIKISNLDIGEYRVNYSGNEFTVYANDLNQKYNIGNSVFVIIPEGDFSNKKLITGKSSTQSLSETQLTQQKNSIKEVSPDIVSDLYLIDSSCARGVVAGVEPGLPKSTDSYPMKATSANSHNTVFLQYSRNYELLQIKALFKTQFQSIHTKGNYGIKVHFDAFSNACLTNTNQGATYILDTSSFNGDPYRLNQYTEQSVILKVPKNFLTNLSSITLFEEGFIYDQIDGPIDEKGNITRVDNTDNPNIFVKNVEIKYVEKIDLTDTTYYLDIQTPKGVTFIEVADKPSLSVKEIELNGRLIYQGKSILNEDTCVCEWFECDPSAMSRVDGYSKTAGIGWRKLSSEAFNIDFNTLILKFEQVAYKQSYKLVVTYNDNVTVSEIVEVTNQINNPKPNWDFRIQQETNGSITKLSIADTRLVGEWYIMYENGAYDKITSSNSRQIDITAYLANSNITFYCKTFYNGTYIGTLEQVITNSDSEEKISIKYDGEYSFRYDANGDITIEDSDKDRTLRVDFTWVDGIASNFKVEWYAPDRQLLNGVGSNKPHNPDNSMMQNCWIDQHNILHYTIRQKFNPNYVNNTYQIVVTTLDGQQYTFDKEILFVKDGDQGTNGTTYVVAIRPCDDNGNLLTKYTPLHYNVENHILYFRCDVYRDGEVVPNEEIEYYWSTAQTLTSETLNKFQTFSVSRNGTINDLKAIPPYVKVKVTIGKNILYASCPIDVFVGNSLPETIEMQIPQYVKYTASGTNPEILSSPIYCKTGKNTSWTITPIDSGKINVKTQDSETYLAPAASFKFEDGKIAAVLCDNPNSTDYIIHSVMTYLDTFGNEAINGWDGTSIYTGEGEGKGDIILAPQVGAGEKNGNNAFSGVLMGVVKQGTDTNTGLFGYQGGINTFKLLSDGTAHFGAPGKGGINISGNDSIIKSSSYDAGITGLMIDLDDEIINSPTFSFNGKTQQFEFKLAGENNKYGSFKIYGANLVPLLEISESIYKLRSDNNVTTLDLKSGYFETHSAKLINATVNNATITSGSITDANINNATIQEGYISTITANELQIFNAKPTGLGTETYGVLGYIQGRAGISGTPTDNIGLKSKNGHSIVLESNNNIRLTALDQDTSMVFIEGKNGIQLRIKDSPTDIGTGINLYRAKDENGQSTIALDCSIPAHAQHGIYARFA